MMEAAGEDELVASWEQVLPFLRLSLLNEKLAESLTPNGESGVQEGVGPCKGLWARVWQPLDPALEEAVALELRCAISRMLDEIENPVEVGDAGGSDQGVPGQRRRRRQLLASRVRVSEACALKAALRVLADVYPQP